MRQRYDKEIGQFVTEAHWFARRLELAHNATMKAPLVFGDLDGFVSPINDELIDGRHEYRNHMKKHDVEPAGDLTLDESLTAKPDWREGMRPLRDVVEESVSMVEKGYKPDSQAFWPDEMNPEPSKETTHAP